MSELLFPPETLMGNTVAVKTQWEYLANFSPPPLLQALIDFGLIRMIQPINHSKPIREVIFLLQISQSLGATKQSGTANLLFMFLTWEQETSNVLENLTFELPKTGFLGTDHHRMNCHLFALLSLLRYALFKEKASKMGCLLYLTCLFLTRQIQTSEKTMLPPLNVSHQSSTCLI